jgi:nitroreductase/NAD-dependent dihydropyrimidine dehydrogenase PreA subunit
LLRGEQVAASIQIDSEKCTGCLRCLEVCFLDNFEKSENGKVNVVYDPKCISCGHCVAVCPVSAVSHENFTDMQNIPESSICDYDTFLNLLKMRRSRREFKKDKIPKELIEKLLEAGINAPNALNKQNVQYTVITDENVIKKFVEAGADTVRKMDGLLSKPVTGTLMKVFAKGIYESMIELKPEIDIMIKALDKNRDVILYNAPCVILVHTEKSDMNGSEDALYCASNILYAADTVGLGACVIGFITQPSKHAPIFKQLAQIPKNHTIHTTICLGYPKFGYARPVQKKPAKVKFI